MGCLTLMTSQCFYQEVYHWPSTYICMAVKDKESHSSSMHTVCVDQYKYIRMYVRMCYDAGED